MLTFYLKQLFIAGIVNRKKLYINIKKRTRVSLQEKAKSGKSKIAHQENRGANNVNNKTENNEEKSFS